MSEAPAPAPVESGAPSAGQPPSATTGPAPTGERTGRRRKRGGKGGGGGGANQGRPAQYWMVVSSPDNFKRTREHGFSIQGIKSRHKKRVESMHSGDRVLYYVTGRMAFAGTVTVTSPMYEDHTIIWRTDRREEDYPYRVHIRADTILEESEWMLAKDIAYRMEYVKKWPPEHWTLAFQGHLHQLPRNDFKLLEDEIQRLLRRRRKAPAPAPEPVAG